MNLISDLPQSGDWDILMAVIDKFTKYCHLFTLSHSFKASDVAQLFLDQVYKFHGPSLRIITDIDPFFTSNF
jgi:hypothetical protein